MMLFNESNPVTLTHNNKDEEYASAFSDFFKPMRAVPFFGDNYTTIVPLFIALIGFFTAFKFFGRLLARATKGIISIDVSENNPEKVAKGEKVVLAEWERRKRKLRQEEINIQRVFFFINFNFFLNFLKIFNFFLNFYFFFEFLTFFKKILIFLIFLKFSCFFYKRANELSQRNLKNL